jgi:hypothetical protein
MTKIMEILKSRKADILAIIILTTTLLSWKNVIDKDIRNYVDSIASILLLWTTALSLWNRYWKVLLKKYGRSTK